MARVPDSRQRLVESASQLFCRQGYAATGVKEIAREGEAPMGSFYFHFPGGKEELGVAALRHGADGFGRLLEEVLDSAGPPEDAMAACALAFAEQLKSTEWLDGCPIATTALESVGGSQALRGAAADAFQAWQDLIGRHLVAWGLAEAAAEELASCALSLLEGAELLARTQGSTRPLEHAAAGLRILTRAALERAA